VSGTPSRRREARPALPERGLRRAQLAEDDVGRVDTLEALAVVEVDVRSGDQGALVVLERTDFEVGPAVLGRRSDEHPLGADRELGVGCSAGDARLALEREAAEDAGRAPIGRRRGGGNVPNAATQKARTARNGAVVRFRFVMVRRSRRVPCVQNVRAARLR
jgi:hypothetical protein